MGDSPLETETEIHPSTETGIHPSETEIRPSTETEIRPSTETGIRPSETEIRPSTETGIRPSTEIRPSETEIHPSTETEIHPSTEICPSETGDGDCRRAAFRGRGAPQTPGPPELLESSAPTRGFPCPHQPLGGEAQSSGPEFAWSLRSAQTPTSPSADSGPQLGASPVRIPSTPGPSSSSLRA